MPQTKRALDLLARAVMAEAMHETSVVRGKSVDCCLAKSGIGDGVSAASLSRRVQPALRIVLYATKSFSAVCAYCQDDLIRL
jgi:hypothetical protein